MALIDDIRKRLAATKTPDVTGTQAQAQKLLQAKTGKAVGAVGGAPKASALGEQAVQAEVRGQAQQQALQGGLAAAQLGQQQQQQQRQRQLAQEGLDSQERMFQQELTTRSQLASEGVAGEMAQARAQRTAQEEMRTAQITSNYNNAVANMASERGIAQDNIWQQFRQGQQELELRQDKAQLEQLAHSMAMADKEYLRELESIGKIRGLENDLTFKKEFAKIQMGDAVDNMMEELGWKIAFDKDEREFQIAMGQMDIDSAIAIADAQIKASNKRAIISGAASGVSAYNQAGGFDSSPTTTPTPQPTTESTYEPTITNGSTYA